MLLPSRLYSRDEYDQVLNPMIIFSYKHTKIPVIPRTKSCNLEHLFYGHVGKQRLK